MLWAKFVRPLAAGLAAAALLGGAVLCGTAAALPDTFYVSAGESLTVASMPWVKTGESHAAVAPAEAALADKSRNVTLTVLGVPVKTVRAVTAEPRCVCVCGTPFGVKMFSDGALVVAFSDRYNGFGGQNPAKQAGLRLGDWIVSVGGYTIRSNEDVSSALQSGGGKPLRLVYRRGGQEHTANLTPVLDTVSGQYRAGVWVRDSGAGIGTLTFIDPETSAFAGLGHAVSDTDTGENLSFLAGEIVPVTVTGCRRGEVGSPGELRGEFMPHSIGTIQSNAACGVFGRYTDSFSSFSTLPTAHIQAVHSGAAEILTTVSGSSPQRYTAVIERINLTCAEPNRNLLLRITDPALLDSCGGIVQGMSGSPILQDGALVGAVTHVFVNDPTRGYGILIENMLSEMP